MLRSNNQNHWWGNSSFHLWYWWYWSTCSRNKTNKYQCNISCNQHTRDLMLLAYLRRDSWLCYFVSFVWKQVWAWLFLICWEGASMDGAVLMEIKPYRLFSKTSISSFSLFLMLPHFCSTCHVSKFKIKICGPIFLKIS